MTYLLWQVGHALLGSNFHTVLEGRVYRGAQPSPRAIERLVQDQGVRTIVNLRGCCAQTGWYRAECRAVQHLGITLEDICLSAARLPSSMEMKRLVEVLDHADYPIYLHCRRGADRTGLAAAIVLLLQEGTTLYEARRQLSVRFGHLPFGKTGVLDRYLDLYETWLQAHNEEHAPDLLRRWVSREYSGGWCSSTVEECTPLQHEARIGEPLAYKMRVRNTGSTPWRMRPGASAGVHLGYTVWDNENEPVFEGRGGHFERTVAPGECVETTLVVGPLTRPGRFRLLVDMVEEGHCWFYQAGAVPWEQELVVRE